MALLQELHEIGILKISDGALAALQKIADAATSDPYDPAILTDEEQTALDALKQEWLDDPDCKRLRELLVNLGILGCAVSRRIKAVLAALGLTDEEMEDCLKSPQPPTEPRI